MSGTARARLPVFRLLWHLVVGVVVVAAVFTLAGVVGLLIARPTGSVPTFVVIQSVLGLVLVAFVVRWRTTVGLRAGVPALPLGPVPAVLAYLLLPTSWVGTTLFGWRIVGTGGTAFVVDLLLWVAVVGVGVLWGDSQEKLRRPAATPYG